MQRLLMLIMQHNKRQQRRSQIDQFVLMADGRNLLSAIAV